ncbi:MAG: biopolymer transporter ExbD [Planctomycetaceae bacterium]|nr:biopolymer transporter ExbD [Planctomycetaceae bacterium]HCK40897.1 biopolymer transporter ExbD [Planctomycetaceae bacterium]|tara:strand:+ start:254 stop:685 length:432 start_codon:yes stop_codon:yes gene_type:complete
MPLKTQQDEQPSLNLTPMIDVVFLLIIFFMVATSFAEMEQDIELELPEVAAAAAMTSAPKQRVVAVHADGHCTLDSKTMSLPELTEQLRIARNEYPELSVVIRGDAACAFQHVAACLAACKEAKISELGITVRVAIGAQKTVR